VRRARGEIARAAAGARGTAQTLNPQPYPPNRNLHPKQALEAQQDEMHAERRSRSAQLGRASMEGLLWAANPAWQGSFLEDMERLGQQGREAEAGLSQGAGCVAVLLQTVRRS
jgi:hypothetical protein